jgi:hypothetical protein
MTCPRSFITPESQSWIYEFQVRRRLGGSPLEQLSAREAEAFLLLEEQLADEQENG